MRIQGRNLYLSWITMTQKEREEMYVESFTNKKTRSLFNKISASIRVETNKRLRALEKKGFDYGRTYNNLIRYLPIEKIRVYLYSIERSGRLNPLKNRVEACGVEFNHT